MRPKKNRPDSSTSCNSAYRAMETQIVGDVCAEFGSKRIAHRILRPEMFALMFRPRTETDQALPARRASQEFPAYDVGDDRNSLRHKLSDFSTTNYSLRLRLGSNHRDPKNRIRPEKPQRASIWALMCQAGPLLLSVTSKAGSIQRTGPIGTEANRLRGRSF